MVKKCLSLIFISQVFVCQSVDNCMVSTPQSTVKSSSNTSMNESASIEADKEFCLATLRNSEADINALSPSGKTPLQLLTLYFINNFETQQLIALALKRGANVNIIDEHGRTPLFFIVAYTLCPEVFKEKQKIVDDAINTAQETPALQTKEVPLENAISAANAVTVQKNQEKTESATLTKPMRNPLHDKTTSMEVVKMLLSQKADPMHADHEGISPLLLAITMGNQEMVNLFVLYGLLEKVFDNEQDQAENSESENNLQNDTTESAEIIIEQA